MGSMIFIFLASLTLTLTLTLSGCVERFPRQLPGIWEPKQFRWGKRHALLMNSNGTVEVKLSQEHNCEACKVQLRSLCGTHTMQVRNYCPKSTSLPVFGKRVNTAATAMMMKFIWAGKYLCLHRNRTFYAVDAHANVSNLPVEECAFFIVQEHAQAKRKQESSYASIFHFKYPQGKRRRNCRLKQRKANAANTTCYKFYLRKGKGDILTVTRKLSFNESRWGFHVKERNDTKAVIV